MLPRITFIAVQLWLLFSFPLWGEVNRIVSLQPSNTEILFALGVGEKLVGVSNFCDFPEAAKKIEKVGDFIHPNIEKVISLKPDIVFAGKWQTSQIVPRLRGAGLKVIEIKHQESLKEIYDSILEIARLVERESAGRQLVQKLRKKVEMISNIAKKRKRIPTVYIEVDLPNWTVSKKNFVSEAIESCGTKNIFEDLPTSAAQISWEEVVKRNPDLILLFSAKKEEVVRRPGWKNIIAVKNGHVIDDIPRELLVRPTPRIVLGMEELFQRLNQLGY